MALFYAYYHGQRDNDPEDTDFGIRVTGDSMLPRVRDMIRGSSQIDG